MQVLAKPSLKLPTNASNGTCTFIDSKPSQLCSNF